jgi:glutathione-regulated potassium-efflux system ancillary protein KefG
MRRQILLIHAHPMPHRSRVNRHLVEAAKTVEGVTIRHLYELYPDYMIDVEQEQNLLLQHDILVLQHPFFWYSAPALLKEWLDLVLQHGWAYGEGGTALHGKCLLQAVTTGGTAEIYCSSGRNRHSVREFLLPFEQTARLCGMTYLDPFVVHGTGQLQTMDVLTPHSQRYCELLSSLASGIDPSPSP